MEILLYIYIYIYICVYIFFRGFQRYLEFEKAVEVSYEDAF